MKVSIGTKKEATRFDKNVIGTGFCYSRCHKCINYVSKISCSEFRMVMKKIGLPDCDDKRIVYINN